MRTTKIIIIWLFFSCLVISIEIWTELGFAQNIDTLIINLRSEDELTKGKAAVELRDMGRAAISAIPALIDCLNDYFALQWELSSGITTSQTTVGLEAAQALVKIGDNSAIVKHVVPLLTKYVSNTSYGIETAIWILEEIGKDSKQAVPVLLELMEKYSSDDLLCMNPEQTYTGAMSALSKIAPNDSNVIKALIKHLEFYSIGRSGDDELNKESDLRIRKAAIEALGNVGPKAKNAVPLIIRALKDYVIGEKLLVERWENEVWEPATKALGNIGPEAKAAVPFIIDGISKLNDCHIVSYGHLALCKITQNNLGFLSPGTEWWQWDDSYVNLAREKWLKWWEENKKNFADYR
jgi:HEAT repeat protein